MARFKIYHNPRCSKSRQTLALLTERGITPDIIEYLKTPPTAAELQTLLAWLAMSPRQLLRKNEQLYKDLGLAAPDLTEKQLITAMVDYPKLIERPIVVDQEQQRAIIGRPPEQILTWLN